MGLLRGALAYRRYRLLGDLPKNYEAHILAGLTKGAFQPIKPDDSEMERSVGWVTVQDALDTEFDTGKVFVDDLVLFALRIDTRKFSPRVLRAYVQKAEREYQEKNNRDNLTRTERRNIKDLVRKELLSRAIPDLVTHDVAIDLTEGEVRFACLTQGTLDQFQELFEAMFGQGLLPLGLFGLITKLDPQRAEDGALETVQPSVFARRGRS